MTCRLFIPSVLLCLAAGLHAQTDAASQAPPRFQLYGGYSFVSNSPNGMAGAHQPMNGWNASFGVPNWHFIRFVIDVSSYRGTNLGAQENVYYIMGGTQFTRRFGRESAFLEGYAGEAGINRYWGPQGAPGETASFVTLLGGGVDTPISRRFAFRVHAGYQGTNFKLIDNVQQILPIPSPGIPNNFFRIASGLVWNF
ncbi:MAG: hypothetical protein ABSB50_07610 [Terracidiphilus sp.]